MANEKTTTKKASVLLRPRVTEKAALKADKDSVYVFNVTTEATERSIKASVKEAYNVTPLRVRMLNIPTKKVFRRGKPGTKGGGKKAYVYLKKGDRIEII